jgi:hypothetical protein
MGKRCLTLGMGCLGYELSRTPKKASLKLDYLACYQFKTTNLFIYFFAGKKQILTFLLKNEMLEEVTYVKLKTLIITEQQKKQILARKHLNFQ